MPEPAIIHIDGSYVTDKELPNDVDVAIDVSGCSLADQDFWFGEFGRRHNEIKDKFRTDFYPYVQSFGSDFGAFFQYVRPEEALERGMSAGDRKGLLRIVQ